MSESFRHLWGRTDKATPPTPDPRERGEARVDHDAAEAIARAALGSGHDHLVLRDGFRRLARAYLALRVPDPRERGEAVPSFWAVLRDDNEMMATGKTHDEAVREFMRLRGGDYANAVKEGYRCVAVFTNWPALRAPAPSEAVAWMVEFRRPDESKWQKSGPHFSYAEAERDQTRLLLRHWPAHIVPLYTHPAPAREAREEADKALAALRAAYEASESCGCDNESNHADCLSKINDAVREYLAALGSATPDAEGEA